MIRLSVAAGFSLLLALAVALIAGKVAGQDATIRVGSGTAGLGEQVSVNLEALNIAPPGLGMWTIDIIYDPEVVAPDTCSAQQGGFCNPAFDTDTVRVTGASGTGLVGDVPLAVIRFECGDVEGSSTLTVILSLLVDAGPGSPQHIAAFVENGRIDCIPPPTATPTIPGQEQTIRVGSGTAGLGEQVSGNLDALNIAPPGLGAWQIGINYDSTVVTAISCSGYTGSVCNPTFRSDKVRVFGVSLSGLVGDTTLALITFECRDLVGSSALTITLSALVDATFPPQDIAASVENGRINCVEVATPTPTPSRLLGDPNCSGTVDAVDALFILQFEARLVQSLPCPWNADVHQDGSVDSIDAALILQFVAGVIHRLPP